ncbi:MAG TPA: alpha/beta hydrolase [Calditerricola sp.]
MGNVAHLRVKTGTYETHLNRAGQGSGEAILFIHGSGPGATAWSNWQYALPFFSEQGFDCIAPDLVGFGQTDHPETPPHGMRAWMRLWVDQLLALLDALGIAQAHVVGNSLGGAIALHLLVEAPERFCRAVLMGPAGAPCRLTPELDRVWGFYTDPSPKTMAQLIRWFAYDERIVGDQLERISQMRFAAAMDPAVRRSYEAMFPAPRQRHLDELVVPAASLRRIGHPVLLVHGRDDPIVPLETSYFLVQHIPRAKLMVYGQCGHWTQVEHRDSFHRLLLDFFTGAV